MCRNNSVNQPGNARSSYTPQKKLYKHRRLVPCEIHGMLKSYIVLLTRPSYIRVITGRIKQMSTSTSGDSLQIVPRDEYPKLVDFLRGQTPSSLKVIGHLNSNIKSEKWTMSTYVDSWPNPSVVVCVIPTAEGVTEGDLELTFHSNDADKLKHVLSTSNLLNWRSRMMIKGFDRSFLPILEEINPNYSALIEDLRGDVYTCTDDSNLYRGVVPDGYKLSSLKKGDIDTIMKVWKFGNDRLRQAFLTQVDTHFNAGVFSNKTGELVSWAVQQYFGVIGAVNTIEPHRRKGLAKITLSDVTRKVLDSGETAWCYVEDVKGKEVSENMMTSVGYHKTDLQHVWLICKPPT
ncbi:glycine N-phenylacetyltransferase-like [Glandiceps talaboti]